MEDSGIESNPEVFTNEGLSDEEVKEITQNAYSFIQAQPTEEGLFGPMEYDPRAEMMLGLEKIPSSIGRRFDAHGIAKGSMTDQIKSLNQLLTTGIDKTRPFHSMPLTGAEEAAVAFGASGPYEGSFIILGDIDKPLTEGVKFVLTNEPFDSSHKLLSEKFPQTEFIPIKSAPQRLGEIAG